MSDELDEDQKPDELQRDTTASEVKESLKLANDAVAVALEGVVNAEAGVLNAEAGVLNAETGVGKAREELDQWNEFVKSNLSNPNMLNLYLKERDKARESLTKARESLTKARESLTKARESLTKARESLTKARESLDKARSYGMKQKHNVQDVAALQATERARIFVASIMKEDVLEDIPDSDGMRVMRNVPDLETGRESVTLIVRNIADKFWEACISTVAIEGHRVCAVGTPGIGKTTATPYLIRMLLKLGNTVVYLVRSVRKQNWFYEFIPAVNNNVEVAVYRESTDELEIPSLTNNSTYYIVDPGTTKNDCVPGYYVPAKFILVSSPLDRHWGGSEFRKRRHGFVGIFRYYPIWTLQELKQASAILDNTLIEEDINERYRQFGGIPRTVFQPKGFDFEEELSFQDLGLASLTAEMAESLCARKLVGVASFTSTTKSAVIGFNSSANKNYANGVPTIISDQVYEKVCNKYMTNLWNLMFSDIERGRSLFEAYTRFQMTQRRDFLARSCVGASDELYNDTGYVRLGECTCIRMAGDIVDAAKKSKGDLFHSSNKGNPMIDFIYQDEKGVFHAFQVTVGENHNADPSQIEELENQIDDAQNNLRLYYLVPGEKFQNFVTNPVQPDVSCSVYHVLVPKPGEE